MGQRNEGSAGPTAAALGTSFGASTNASSNSSILFDSSTSRKRARVEAETSASNPPANPNPGYSYDGDDQAISHSESRSWDAEPPKQKKAKSDDKETRLRRFRPNPPKSFHDIYARAVSQRFYVLSRTRCGTAWCPEEFLEITGSTGNVYSVCIAQKPTCNCPHFMKGNQCKHIVFVLHRVLRVKYNYVYQLALLSEELRDIFSSAPPPVDQQAVAAEADKKRKSVEGDCPICFEEMKTASGSEALVWCKAACGQNIHHQCFEMWANTKRASSTKVTCPYCRSDWEGDSGQVNLANVKKYNKVGEDGYYNVADQLGISTKRDYSTYSRWGSRHPQSYRRRFRW